MGGMMREEGSLYGVKLYKMQWVGGGYRTPNMQCTYMLGARYGFAKSMDSAAQTMDLYFV